LYQFFYKIKTFDSITNTDARKINFYMKFNKNANYKKDVVKGSTVYTKLKSYSTNYLNNILQKRE